MSNNDFREIIDEETVIDQILSGEEKTEEVEDTDKDYEDICYICHRPERTAGKMVKIPGNICICNDCLQRTFDTMNYGGFPMDGFMMPGMMPSAVMEVEQEEEEGESQDKSSGKKKKIPTISMINLADLQGFGMPHAQKIKKKKPGEERTPIIDIKAIPAPHKIKASLDEYVVGQEQAKR